MFVLCVMSLLIQTIRRVIIQEISHTKVYSVD